MTTLTIKEGNAGQRLDKYLRSHFQTLPLSTIYKLLRKKKIVLNSKKADPAARLEEGDVLTFKFHPEFLQTLQEESKRKADNGVQLAKPTFQVLFEDQYLLIVNKPAGLPAHGGSDTGSNTLINQVLTYLKYTSASEFKPALVHRLDQDTSGAVIIGKKRDVVVQMNDLIKKRNIQKKYIALIIGRLTQPEGTIKTRLERVEGRGPMQKVRAAQSSEEGKPAVTEYTTLKTYRDYSLLGLRLITGRTHQIRAHLAHLSHPIVCDERYGNFEDNHSWKKRTGLKRQFLHAEYVEFIHPITNSVLKIKADLPEDLEKTITYLEKNGGKGTAGLVKAPPRSRIEPSYETKTARGGKPAFGKSKLKPRAPRPTEKRAAKAPIVRGRRK